MFWPKFWHIDKAKAYICGAVQTTNNKGCPQNCSCNEFTVKERPKYLSYLREMEDKTFCHVYNIGYCKYKTKCLKEHAKIDCLIEGCNSEICYKRHRKHCLYGNKCAYKQKNSCESEHNSESLK